MSADRLRRAEEIFVEALDKPLTQRTRFLRDRCANDAALLAEVKEMLALATRAGDGFLNPEEIRQLTAGASTLDTPEEPALPPGTRIGTYTLKNVLGAGGMGLVYLAEQERPKRTVALKLIRRGLSATQILRRFEHEAEVLGLLHDPGIAQIYEAGAADVAGTQQPFIAMEYIDGPDLRTYADREKLDTRGRMALMARVATALHHAHQRGVIHRDLKPGNILVTCAGQPKILDFGVARAMHSDIRVTTMRTSVGQLIGTLAYMSPEQVEGDPAGIDTRSDVYALGVLLYELLTGRLPHNLASRSLPEAARAIRQDPPTKLSHVSRVFRGEIDTIVGKALEKDKARRYQSAAEFGEDLRRYLAGEPIHARHDSALYVLRTQLKKHRWTFAAAIAAILGLLAFSIYAQINAQRQRELALAAGIARTAAQKQADLAQQANQRLEDELFQSTIDRGRLEAAAGNLSLAEDYLWRAYLQHPDQPATTWALTEMHQRAPALWTIQADVDTLAAAFSPDRSTILIGTRSALVLLDAGTGKELRRHKNTGAPVSTLATGPTGFAAGLVNGRILLLSGDGAPLPLGDTPAHAGAVVALAFSADGRALASAGEDKLLRLWDLSTSTSIRQWQPHDQPASCLAFSRDGARLVTGGRLFGPGNAVRVWSTADASRLSESGTLPGAVTALLLSHDDSSLLIGTRDGSLTRMDAASGACETLPVHCDYSISSLRRSPDGQRLLVVGGDILHVCSADGTTALRTIKRLPRYELASGWLDDSTAIVSMADGALRALDLRADPGLRRLSGFRTWCFSIAYSPDGKRLAIGATGDIRIADAQTLETRFEIPVRPDDILIRTRDARFLADSRTLITAHSDGALRIYDSETGTLTTTLPSSAGEAYGMDLDNDQRTLAVGHAGAVIDLWNIPERRHLARWPRLQHRIETLAFSRDARTIVSAGLADAVQLWDVASGTPTTRLPTSGEPWGVAYSPDGATLAVSTYDGTVDIFDVPSQTRRATIHAHGRLIPGLTFSPDGRLFATGGEDGAVKLWDAASLRNVLTLDPGGTEVVMLAFDPTGRHLAGATSRRLCAVYDLHALDHCIPANAGYQRQRLRPDQR